MSVIVRVAARGEGVAEDGRHAAFAAPGDTLAPDGGVVPGPHHQVPPCRHFPECGGCQLQHLDDASWSGFLTDRVTGALAAQGLEAEVRAPLLSPPRTRRRATLHYDPSGRLGFSAAKSHQLIDLAECHILAPELFALVKPLKRLLPGFRPKRRLDLQLTLADQGPDLLVTGVAPEGLAAHETITAFATAHGLARVAFDDGLGPETRWEPDAVTVTLGGVPVPLPPGAFLQATREGEAALVEAVLAGAGAPKRVADLFCGAGTFTFALAAKGAEVLAVDDAARLVQAVDQAAKAAKLARIATRVRDLATKPMSPQELAGVDVVVFDPPRAGAQAQALQLAKSRVPTVLAVSCEPGTFARDAQILAKGGYKLKRVLPIDQFLWSPHVELAAVFKR